MAGNLKQLAAEPSVNGVVPMGAVIERHIEWVTIKTPPYAGMRFRAWINAPFRVTKGFADDITYVDTFRKVFFEHDGWSERDEDGNVVPLPPMSDAEAFTDAISNELLQILMAERRGAEAKVQLFNPGTGSK